MLKTTESCKLISLIINAIIIERNHRWLELRMYVHIEMMEMNFALILIWRWSLFQDRNDEKRCGRSFRHGFLMMPHLACARQCVDAPIAATGEQLRPSVSSNYAIIGTTDDCPAITTVGFSFAISWAWAKLTTRKIWKIEGYLGAERVPVRSRETRRLIRVLSIYIFMRQSCNVCDKQQSSSRINVCC